VGLGLNANESFKEYKLLIHDNMEFENKEVKADEEIEGEEVKEELKEELEEEKRGKNIVDEL